MKVASTILATSLAMVLAACGGSESTGGVVEPTPPTPTPTPEPVASAMLGLADMTISIEGNEAIKVYADGRVEANIDQTWKQVATIKDDAIVAEGNNMASVDADGNITFKDGPGGIKFNGASVTFGDKTLAIGDDGIVTGLNPGAEGKVRVSGATDEASKRTALVMVLGVFMMAKGEASQTRAEEAPSKTPAPGTP